MKSEGVQVAKIERDTKITQAVLTELGNFASNPVVQLIGGYVAVEALQRGDKPIFDDGAAMGVESALWLAVVLGSVGKAVESVGPALAAIPGLKALAPR